MQSLADSLFSLLVRRAQLGTNVGALDFLLGALTEKLSLRASGEVYRSQPCRSKPYSAAIAKLAVVPAGQLPQHPAELFAVALSARKTQMLETYLDCLIKLLPKASVLTPDEKTMLRQHVKSAYVLSQNSSILAAAFANLPLEMAGFSLPEKLRHGLPVELQQLVGRDETDEAVAFDHYDDEKWLAVIDTAAFTNAQHRLGLAINRACTQGGYLLALNQMLRYYHLAPLTQAKAGTGALTTFQFASTAKRTGELVTVIMACFNAASTIEYAMQSLLQQSHQSLQILVCDDGSTDDTMLKLQRLAKADARIRLYRSKANQGSYNIRNHLIPKAEGRYITFHDADDLAHPERIERQLRHLTQNHLLVTSCRWVRVSDDGRLHFFFDGQLVKFCVVSTLVDKAVFGLLPAFRQALVAADTEFYENCRYYLGKSYIGVLDEPLIFGLWGDESLTRQPGLSAENTGFVAAKRRHYSELAARQRVFGPEHVSDAYVDEQLKTLDIYRESQGVLSIPGFQ